MEFDFIQIKRTLKNVVKGVGFRLAIKRFIDVLPPGIDGTCGRIRSITAKIEFGKADI